MDEDLERLSRGQLQQLAKKYNVKANLKSSELRAAIRLIRNKQLVAVNDANNSAKAEMNKQREAENQPSPSAYDHSIPLIPKTPAISNSKFLKTSTPSPSASSDKGNIPEPTPKSILKEALKLERERRRQSRHFTKQDSPMVTSPATKLISVATPFKLPLSESWEKVESKSKPGQFYYWNRRTQEATWNIPATLSAN